MSQTILFLGFVFWNIETNSNRHQRINKAALGESSDGYKQSKPFFKQFSPLDWTV